MDTRTGQQVAIKVISMKEINNEVKRYLLMTEQCALQGLKHPNIIRCLDVIQEPSDFYFVTEYCPQGTLNEYIQRKGTTELIQGKSHNHKHSPYFVESSVAVLPW